MAEPPGPPSSPSQRPKDASSPPPPSSPFTPRPRNTSSASSQGMPPMILVIAFLIGGGLFVFSQNKNSEPLPVGNESPAFLQQAGIISYQGVDGVDALTLLKRLHAVGTKDFDVGEEEFVEQIDGMRSAQDEFWGFFINGEAATVGAGSYITKNEDIIEWKIIKRERY